MNLPLLALAIAAFGIGTTEFVILGLLPEVAGDLSVSIPAAGMLVSAYAPGRGRGWAAAGGGHRALAEQDHADLADGAVHHWQCGLRVGAQLCVADGGACGRMFTLFTYITPILRDVTGVSPQNVSGVLLLCGVGLTIGNLLGGRLADWKLLPSLMGIFAVLAGVLAVFSFTSEWLWPAIVTVVVWGMVSFAAGTPLQARVVSQAGDAPSLASTLNIGAFNLGNAIGAWLGARSSRPDGRCRPFHWWRLLSR